eukprot:6188191-Pleurochrysis_carterae.AAC.1
MNRTFGPRVQAESGDRIGVICMYAPLLLRRGRSSATGRSMASRRLDHLFTESTTVRSRAARSSSPASLGGNLRRSANTTSHKIRIWIS